MDGETCLVGELLQTPLPEAVVGSIAGAAITEDEDIGGVRRVFTPPGIPPSGQGGYGKFCGIMVYPDVHEPLFLQDIVDPVGNSLHDPAFFLLAEIIDVHFGVFPWSGPFLSRILHVSDLFGLLGVHGQDKEALTS